MQSGTDTQQQSEQADSEQTESEQSGSQSEKAQPSSPQQAQYISSVSSAVNLKVLAELLGISVLLAAAGAAVAVGSIMRYEPLKILSNRD